MVEIQNHVEEGEEEVVEQNRKWPPETGASSSNYEDNQIALRHENKNRGEMMKINEISQVILSSPSRPLIGEEKRGQLRLSRSYSEISTYKGEIRILGADGKLDITKVKRETNTLELSWGLPKKIREPEVPASAQHPLTTDDVAIPIAPPAETNQRPLISGEPRSKSREILKCIVNGGLMASIASFCFVSSAAAFDATTLNVIALGVASAICGLLVFGHNLMDLKNWDENEETDRYQELLGTRGHFLFHATFAILSFLVFGIIPPLVYGFVFRESDSKDYKIPAVAAASFASVFILGIGKAYVRRSQKFSEYVKTILYYIFVAVSVSGVAYAAEDLIKMLMDRDQLGWFQPNRTAPSFVPDAISATQKWASY